MKITLPILALSLLLLPLTGCSGTSGLSSDSEAVGDYPLPKPTAVVDTLQKLSNFVDYAIFNRWSSATVTWTGNVIKEFDVFLAKVYWTAQLVGVDPVISGKLTGDKITIYLDYRPERVLLTASESPAYIHGRDVTYVPFISSRDETFTDFPYRSYDVGVSVTTSDQLWYCLDQGYRPLPTPGSKAETYLAQCEDILRGIVDDTMDDEQKVRAIYNWESFTISYDYEAARLSTSDAIAATYDAFYLEGVLDHQRGVCDAYAKLFTLLVNMEGIPCKRVLGPSVDEYVEPTIGSVGHAWNIVQIDQFWYTIDPTGGNAIFRDTGVGIASHQFYLTTEDYHIDNYANHYLRYCYIDIMAQWSYDYFSQAYFDPSREASPANDLVMESMDEFVDYLAYAHDLPVDENYPSLSAEVRIGFAVTGDFSSQLDTAMNESGWGTSWQGPYRFNSQDGRLLIYLR